MKVTTKIVLTWLTALLCASMANAQSVAEDIHFEERVFNFGTIKEANGKVSHTFVFQNKGRSAVSIDDVNSACGCIGNVMTKGPVKPGKKGAITITFDPAYKSGFFSKEIVVLSNNNQQYNRIWVEGTVEPAEHPIEDDYPYNYGNGLYLRLNVLTFAVKPGETGQMELHFANTTDKEMIIDFVTTGNKEGLHYENPGKVPPKTNGVVNFKYTMPTLRRRDAVFTINPYIDNNRLKENIIIKVLNERTLRQKKVSAMHE